MSQTKDLYDLSISSVQEACHKYLLDKDMSLFFKRSYIDDIPMIGITKPNWEGNYKIESEHFQGYIQNERQCLVHARLLLCDIEEPSGNGFIIDVTILCTKKDTSIKYSSIHMTNPKKKSLIFDPDMMNDSNYHKLLNYMYDVIMEYRMNDNSFIYDNERYKKLFHRDGNFLSMDQWFWDLCNAHLYEEDNEKIDLFRDTDIKKRLKKKDYVIKTDVRIRRDDTECMWLKIIFVLIPNEDSTNIERLFILIKDYTREMIEKVTNLTYARMDALTQIWNRRYSEELISAKVEESGTGLFAIFDVDNFKDVNDIFGHMTGDDLLIKISETVMQHITDDDVFGRLGGDEFVLYLSGDFHSNLSKFADILGTMRFIYSEENAQLIISCSAGVVKVTDNSLTFNDLYLSADNALYESKRAGKNTYRVHK